MAGQTQIRPLRYVPYVHGVSSVLVGIGAVIGLLAVVAVGSVLVLGVQSGRPITGEVVRFYAPIVGLPIMVALLGVSGLYWCRRTSRSAAVRMACPGCFYSLVRTNGSRCPECGREGGGAEARAYWERRSDR